MSSEVDAVLFAQGGALFVVLLPLALLPDAGDVDVDGLGLAAGHLLDGPGDAAADGVRQGHAVDPVLHGDAQVEDVALGPRLGRLARLPALGPPAAGRLGDALALGGLAHDDLGDDAGVELERAVGRA